MGFPYKASFLEPFGGAKVDALFRSIINLLSLEWSSPTPPYPVLSYPTLPYPILSYPILPYPVLSYPILSYITLSYYIIAHHIENIWATISWASSF